MKQRENKARQVTIRVFSTMKWEWFKTYDIIRILTHTYFFKPHTSQAFSGHMVSVTVDVEMSELKRGLHGLLVGPMDHARVYVFVIRF